MRRVTLVSLTPKIVYIRRDLNKLAGREPNAVMVEGVYNLWKIVMIASALTLLVGERGY